MDIVQVLRGVLGGHRRTRNLETKRMRSVFRSGFGQNSVARLTTRELGKHRVVSKHPQKPMFCTHTVIFGPKIWKSRKCQP